MEILDSSINRELDVLIGNDFLSVWPLHGIVEAFFFQYPLKALVKATARH